MSAAATGDRANLQPDFCWRFEVALRRCEAPSVLTAA
jgi:hypothetical protein